MNRSKLLIIVLLVIVIVLGGSGSWRLFGRLTGFSYANADKYTAGNAEISDPVENLDIDWTSGQINIEYHTGSGVTVSETSPKPLAEEHKLRWWLDGKTLRIRYIKDGITLTFGLDKTLTVSLPRGTTLKKAEISATSADISTDNLLADEIVFDTTSGDLNVYTSAKKLTAGSTSGDITIQQRLDLDSVNVSSTSGFIGLTLGNAKNVDVGSTSGAIRVTASGSIGNIRLDSTSGSITPDLQDVEKADFSSTSGDITATLASFTDLNVDATSGDVSLKLTETTGFTLDLDARPKKLRTTLPMAVKDEGKYVFGDGSARLRVSTTSGGIRIEKY